MLIQQAENYRDSIISLLLSLNLPVCDLPATLDNFCAAINNNKLIGVAGLEIYGDNGLLRSLAVAPGSRNLGVADKLLKSIEELAVAKGLKAIYLLTETAPCYFTRKDYLSINRNDVPLGVQQSSEFSQLCPQSAIVMKKIIK